MKLDIDTANAAKTELLSRFGALLESATIVLGDHGFRIEVISKPGVRHRAPPAEIQGVALLWL